MVGLMNDAYQEYVQYVGIVRSGTAIVPSDYNTGLRRQKPMHLQVAISLAVEDVKAGTPLRTKPDFDEQLKRLLGA
jgi:hypothetical protein